MRARKKIRGSERFGVRHQDAGTLKLSRLTEWEPSESAARARHAECRKKKRTCRFVRGTSVRLAPLVELPSWESVHDGLAVIDRSTSLRRAFIEIDGDPSSEDGCNYEAFVYGAENAIGLEILASMLFESSDISEVMTWVDEHLRELGFKVAKEARHG